jgi:hypothetical protein
LCLLIHIRICNLIVAILALLPVEITAFQVKPLEFSRGPSSPAGVGHGIALFAFVSFIFAIPSSRIHPVMQFVIRAIVPYRDVLLSASDLNRLKRHFGGQTVETKIILNKCCSHSDDKGRRLVLRLLDL